MGTPAMLVGPCARTVLSSLLWFWLFTFAVGRLYFFHGALHDEWTRLRNEEWLVQQCNDPAFFFNMKEHTDLCSVVIHNSRSNPYLNALHAAASGVHLCGQTSCADVFHVAAQRFGWHLAVLCLLCALFCPHILYALWSLVLGGATPLERRERALLQGVECYPFLADDPDTGMIGKARRRLPGSMEGDV